MKRYELTVAEDNIMKTINEDWLGRNAKLINLMKLLNNLNENFIISIDGVWGSGKTFFVKQLKYISNNLDSISYFKNNKDYDAIKSFSEKHLVVYYNAWENDNHETPLESLIYNVLNEYPKYKDFISNPTKTFKAAKPILQNLIDKVTMGIVTKECFEQLKSFEDLEENINTLEEKQKALNDLFNLIIENNRRILLIVDELDRCKPDYAVKMLETLKHFYNNDKLTILVSTNNNQLSHTVKHFYGYGFDGYSYLNKMYDTVITLEIENLENYVQNHCSIMAKTHLPENMSFLLFKHLSFSYRECNKYMSMYRIVEPYIDYKDAFNRDAKLFESSMILPMTIALKIKDIDEYNKFINGKGEEFIKEFVKSIDNIEKHKEYKDWFIDILKVSENETLEESFVKQYKQIFEANNKYREFPYFEAISLLGNKINFLE